ncbi:hypothetical protein CRYUN_Cryun33cG0029100 [Craigia yunnanensis]
MEPYLPFLAFPLPFTRTLSLPILFNFSLKPDLNQSHADMETIYHLNSIILSPSSPESSKLASSLICSLAMLNKNKAKFGVAGTIPLLVNAVSGPRSPAAHNLLSSLVELEQYHGNSVLRLLARFNEGLNALTKTDPVVSSMVDVLKGRCMLSKEGAAEILLRLFDESEGCLRDALRLPEFITVLTDISVRGSARA